MLLLPKTLRFAIGSVDAGFSLRIGAGGHMPKQESKIKLSSLNGPATKSTTPSANSVSKNNAKSSPKQSATRSPLLPGGPLLWCLVGLAIGLAVWLGGRTYLKNILAKQLVSASSEEVALQSIDALLRLDANATIEVSRGLAHPEFMVANAAFRALGGQLDAWTKLEPADRLLRMQKVVAELERIPEDIDEDHRILVSGLASRIYADTLSNREIGAGDVLESCRRILSRTDPEHVPTRTARLDVNSQAGNSPIGNTQAAPLPLPVQETSPVPPPLAPLDPPAYAPAETKPAYADREPLSMSGDGARRSMPARMSLSDSASPSTTASETTTGRMHLTAGSSSLPKLRTPEPVDPLSSSASSRSRVIPADVEPLPGAATDSEPAVALGGMDQLPIDQLVRLLGSVQPRVSQAAALMLRQKGMSEANLELAIQLATGSAELRQELLNQLVRRDDLDARPWLLWMAADGQNVVRQQAVSLLLPLVDNDVRRQLRILLNKERDEKIAQTMRQVLASDKK